jgi:hypothetical protein
MTPVPDRAAARACRASASSGILRTPWLAATAPSRHEIEGRLRSRATGGIPRQRARRSIADRWSGARPGSAAFSGCRCRPNPAAARTHRHRPATVDRDIVVGGHIAASIEMKSDGLGLGQGLVQVPRAPAQRTSRRAGRGAPSRSPASSRAWMSAMSSSSTATTPRRLTHRTRSIVPAS